MAQEKDSLSDFKSIVRDMPGCVYWKDLQGVYSGCNKIFLYMFGLTSYDEVIGKTDKNFLWQEDYEILRTHDLLILETKQPVLFVLLNNLEINQL